MPDSLLLFIAVALLCGAAVAEARRLRHAPPRHLDGWWHDIEDFGVSWMPQTWRDACDQSTRKSRERRGVDDDDDR